MTGSASTLEQVLRGPGRERFVAANDPYDALKEMGRRRWPAVVLTAPQPDFAGLARASRRLQPESSLFGLCPPMA